MTVQHFCLTVTIWKYTADNLAGNLKIPCCQLKQVQCAVSLPCRSHTSPTVFVLQVYEG